MASCAAHIGSFRIDAEGHRGVWVMFSKRWAMEAVRRLRPRTVSGAERSVGPAMEQLEPRQLLATYYISPFGSDANPGTSTTRPWQTLGKVALKSFVAGDQILLQGGQFFNGTIYFT